MALAIDGSSPVTATSATATVTSAAFTPPTSSLLIARWAGNSHAATLNDGPPTITDSTGLTWTLAGWQSRADAPTVDGQAAIWWAVMGTSTSMTVSVTNHVNVIWGEKHGALRVTVVTGQDALEPVGSSSQAGSASATAIAATYVGQSDGGWFFGASCDWDTLGTATAGTGATMDDAGTIAGQISYAFNRRTSADDSNGATATLNTTLPSTSTNLSWVSLEVLPAGQPPNTDPPAPALPNYLKHYLAGILYAKKYTAPDPPPLVALPVLDPSSPGVVTQTSITTPTVTSASFTPPAGALIYVRVAWNSLGTENPAAPSITDSLGVHLTWTLLDWQSHADSPVQAAQAMHWYAFATSATAMTVTATVHSSTDSNGAGAMDVRVFTGVDPVTPIGAHGKAASTSATSIKQKYTATRTGGWGHFAACDWNTTGPETPTFGNTVTGSATVGVQITYAFGNRTQADDTALDINTVGSNLVSASSNLAWVWAEILPSLTGTTIDTGLATIGLAATATTAHVAVETGQSPVGLSARVAGVQVAVRTGVDTLGLAATSTTRKVAVVTASATIGLAGTSTIRKVAPAVAASTVGLSSTVASRKVAPKTGSAAVGLAATAASRKAAPATANASVGLAGTSTTRKVAVTVNRGALGLASTSTTVHVATRTGLAAVGLEAFQTGSAPRAVTAVASLGVAASCTGRKVAVGVQRSLVGLAASSTARKVAVTAERCALGLAAASTSRKVVPGAQAATLGTSVRSSVVRVARCAGSSTTGYSATAASRKVSLDTGQSVLGLRALQSGALPRQVVGYGFLGLLAGSTARKVASRTGSALLGLAVVSGDPRVVRAISTPTVTGRASSVLLVSGPANASSVTAARTGSSSVSAKATSVDPVTANRTSEGEVT